MKSSLRIRFSPGSNPPAAASVSQTAENAWIVTPWQEYPEGSRIGLYHFRLDVAVENSGARPQRVHLEVRWPHAPKIVASLLDYAYRLGPSGRLTRLEGRTEGSSIHLTFTVKSGLSWISTNPAWHTSHNDAFFQRLRETGVRTRVLGTTAGGRAIRAAEFGEGPKTILVAARMHPYESASSYTAAGMAEWLAGPSPEARRLLREWRVSIVPIANPDGVATGCTRLTGPNGSDLNIDALKNNDPTALLLKKWIDSHRPGVFLNLHNWMGKTTNGLFYDAKPELWAFLEAFDDMFWDRRTWLPLQADADIKPGDPKRQIFDRYCRETYRSLAYTVEFPWTGSTLASMKRSGVRTLLAALQAHSRRGKT